MGRSDDEVIAVTARKNMRSRKIEPHRLSAKVKEELSASGVFTAAGVIAVLQKVVMESEYTELRRSSLRTDFSASINSINILDDDTDEEQSMPTTQHSLMDKLNASFSSFVMSSIDGLREELDSSHQLSEKKCLAKGRKNRNIAPKRSSIDKGRTMVTDSKSHRFTEVEW